MDLQHAKTMKVCVLTIKGERWLTLLVWAVLSLVFLAQIENCLEKLLYPDIISVTSVKQLDRDHLDFPSVTICFKPENGVNLSMETLTQVFQNRPEINEVMPHVSLSLIHI